MSSEKKSLSQHLNISIYTDPIMTLNLSVSQSFVEVNSHLISPCITSSLKALAVSFRFMFLDPEKASPLQMFNK